MHLCEVYKLICHECGREVEIPAGPAELAETLACPVCGAVLTVNWRSEHAER